MAERPFDRPRSVLRADAPAPDTAVPAILAAELDNRTTAYALTMVGPFEALRQAAAQLAGILVLAAAGSRTATPDHPMLLLAYRSHDEAIDGIRTATPPLPGRHHHRHLTRAAVWIGRALTRARISARPGGTLDLDATLHLLRCGWQELQWAAGALPGFEIVAFEQGCCAVHAPGRQTGGASGT